MDEIFYVAHTKEAYFRISKSRSMWTWPTISFDHVLQQEFISRDGPASGLPWKKLEEKRDPPAYPETLEPNITTFNAQFCGKAVKNM